MANMSQEQIERLMSAVRMKQRAQLAGVPVDSKEIKAAAAYVDANSTNSRQVDESHKAMHERRLAGGAPMTFAGMPKTLAESGLTADGFVFDESQERAIRKLVNGQHVALIGAAGTGKTTLVKHAMAQLIYGGEHVKNQIGLRQLGEEQGPSIAICAFTGIATQVIRSTLPSWLHPACKTIHGLLEYKPSDEEGQMFFPSRNADKKLDHDLIVIDEASMLGLDLWHNLVDALRPSTRVILIGDLNQLKPVADATMFAYALSAGMDKKEGWDIAELTTIHRQKEPAANKIVDGAHAILNGKTPVFDNPKEADWRFIGFELKPRSADAHNDIIGAIRWLSAQPTPGDESRPLFDPYKDLLLTAGNGYDENDSSSLVQQSPLNASLSRIIEPPTEEHPVYIIDAGRETKRFAVGHRVMATKNESPMMKDRVTNGLTGRITKIEPNPSWNGDKAMFGTESDVNAFRKAKAKAAFALIDNSGGFSLESLGNFDTSKMKAEDKPQDEERQASHILTVTYVTGAVRTYSSAAAVSGIQLAYACTVHKAQGSQADTVVIVCHSAVKKQVSREWLYTAVTRARRRVVLLFTRQGLATAVNRQQIYGATLAEKVQRYRAVMDTGRAFVRLNATNDVSHSRDDEQQENYMRDGNDDYYRAVEDEERFDEEG